MSGFRGFPPELFSFFEELEKDNSKAFWSADKTGWEQHVRDPMRALLGLLEDESQQGGQRSDPSAPCPVRRGRRAGGDDRRSPARAGGQ